MLSCLCIWGSRLVCVRPVYLTNQMRRVLQAVYCVNGFSKCYYHVVYFL